MKKSIFSIAMLLIGSLAWADEGMWLMTFIERLKYTDWQKEGLHLTPEEIYSVNNASLKDAVVSFNGYCTGELVSDKGLIFTNHHCGYETIAELSTPENDYLNNGFWAKSHEEELKPESLYVRFLVRMGDATDRILKKLSPKMSEDERQAAIKAEFEAIDNENNENGKYVVETKSFFGGNEFYYFVYQDYTDVRLVGTPPQSIGKFGGTTDNWEWPRHTGDFSIFRVYGDKDGNPAPYSKDNVPLKPKHSLPVKISGVQPNDFAMTIGYPGSTQRYMTSYGIEQALDVEFPAWIEAAGAARSAMKENMDKDRKIAIDYASSYASIDNYWKNRIGMSEALKKLNTKGKKIEIEKRFTDWVNQTPERKAKYGKVLENIKYTYANGNDFVKNRTYLVRGILQGSGALRKAYEFGQLFDFYNQQTPENKERILEKLEQNLKDEFATYNEKTEQDILAATLKVYVNNVSKNYVPAFLQDVKKEYKNDFSAYMKNVFSQSAFTSSSNIISFFKNAKPTDVTNDPLYMLAEGIYNAYRNVPADQKELKDIYAKNYRLFLEGLMASQPNKAFYPDANFTMRLSTGKVVGLPENPKRPSDVKSNYYTTLKGLMRKFLPKDEEWDVPTELIRLHNMDDFGEYANADGSMPVAFLTDNDITGGNSGSPVISGKGELIGIAFDGNWEAMSGDIEYEEKLQRTIVVDIRYVLFVIDKFAGAQNLIQEMKLVK
ncbi:S46 family peptidase [Ornithobacterium rhinotracheale]|uniref:S46 family peptidase n=1 Tax=Ornithobacterium rhinotracheale TaxID=28251 RepID=UPI00129CEE3D|nr:S46 family peptidase [Ornithobacterium rhinotracheale]MRJ11697.1 S46 family peptidase [Ornithobacterium rhinotracheale]